MSFVIWNTEVIKTQLEESDISTKYCIVKKKWNVVLLLTVLLEPCIQQVIFALRKLLAKSTAEVDFLRCRVQEQNEQICRLQQMVS